MRPKIRRRSAAIVYLEGYNAGLIAGKAGLFNPEPSDLTLTDAGSPELNTPTLGVA